MLNVPFVLPRFLIWVCLLVSPAVLAQKGEIRLHLMQPAGLERAKGKLVVNVTVTGKGSVDMVVRDVVVYNSSDIFIGNLPDGVYDVDIYETARTIKGYPPLIIDRSTLSSVAVKHGTPNTISKRVGSDCKYYRDLVSRSCPKCWWRLWNKDKFVVPICRGMPMIDPITGYDPQAGCHPADNHSGCEQKGCTPLWYCKKHKLEF